MEVRAYLLRHIYNAQLVHFPVSQVRDFWKGNRLLVDGSPITEQEMFQLLWRGRGSLPQEYVVEVLNRLEGFLLCNGATLPWFIDKVCQNAESSCVVPCTEILEVTGAYLKMLFTAGDVRHFILQMSDKMIQLLAPGSRLQLISHFGDEQWNRGVLELFYGEGFPSGLPVDNDSWGRKILKDSPRCLNVPSFEEVDLIADCRSIESILKNSTAVFRFSNEALWIDEQKYGARISLHSFLKKRNIPLGPNTATDSQVLEIQRDYLCPIRKRVVLRKGCVYGAPSNLFEIHYKKTGTCDESFVSHLIRLSLQRRELVQEARTSHRKILESCTMEHNAISPVISYMEANLNENLSLEAAARLVCRSPSTLSREFKKMTGRSFKKYQIDLKLNKAEELFRKMPGISVTEAADRLGYQDAFYFSKLFKKHRGISPARARDTLAGTNRLAM